MVESIKNRVSIVEDENLFLRNEVNRISRQNLTFKRQNDALQGKLEAAFKDSQTPMQQKSTKFGTTSESFSSKQYQRTTSDCNDYFKPIGIMNGEGDNNTMEGDRIPVTRFSINLLPMERDLDTS